MEMGQGMRMEQGVEIGTEASPVSSSVLKHNFLV